MKREVNHLKQIYPQKIILKRLFLWVLRLNYHNHSNVYSFHFSRELKVERKNLREAMSCHREGIASKRKEQ